MLDEAVCHIKDERVVEPVEQRVECQAANLTLEESKSRKKANFISLYPVPVSS
jgi:hypothetical protein